MSDYRPPLSKPCQSCPWRVENEDHDYSAIFEIPTQEARESLWDMQRDGDDPMCHCSVPDWREGIAMCRQRLEDGGPWPPSPDDYEEACGMVPRLCPGGLALQHREVLRIHETGFDRYAECEPRGLTRDGLRQVLTRLFGGQVTLPAFRRMKRSEVKAAVIPSTWDRSVGLRPKEGE